MKIIDISNDLLTAEVYEGDPVQSLNRSEKSRPSLTTI